jgi:hypothetical protein
MVDKLRCSTRLVQAATPAMNTAKFKPTFSHQIGANPNTFSALFLG